MRTIAVTMRRDWCNGYDETRDAIDRRWIDLLKRCDCHLLPVPNDRQLAEHLLAVAEPDGALLTGGGHIAAVSGDAGPRDQVENLLIAWAWKAGLPLMGVCRGMQAIAAAAGADLVPVEGHVGREHALYPSGRVVNSYHTYAVAAAPRDFEVVEVAPDGTIEAFVNRRKRTLGIMWHPERATAVSGADLDLISKHFTEAASCEA